MGSSAMQPTGSYNMLPVLFLLLNKDKSVSARQYGIKVYMCFHHQPINAASRSIVHKRAVFTKVHNKCGLKPGIIALVYPVSSWVPQT